MTELDSIFSGIMQVLMPLLILGVIIGGIYHLYKIHKYKKLGQWNKAYPAIVNKRLIKYQQMSSLKNWGETESFNYCGQYISFINRRLASITEKLSSLVLLYDKYFKNSVTLKNVIQTFNNFNKEMQNEINKSIFIKSQNVKINDEDIEFFYQLNTKINIFINTSIVDIRSLRVTHENGEIVNNVNRRIFIVHGRNIKIRDMLKDDLSYHGFTPVILENEPNGGTNFVFDKFTREADTVSYAVVIMSADDFGGLQGDKISNVRTRQNVILELGYFLSRLKQERVFVICEEGVELPSDIKGILYNKNTDQIKLLDSLYRELTYVGYQVPVTNEKSL